MTLLLLAVCEPAANRGKIGGFNDGGGDESKGRPAVVGGDGGGTGDTFVETVAGDVLFKPPIIGEKADFSL